VAPNFDLLFFRMWRSMSNVTHQRTSEVLGWFSVLTDHSVLALLIFGRMPSESFGGSLDRLKMPRPPTILGGFGKMDGLAPVTKCACDARFGLVPQWEHRFNHLHFQQFIGQHSVRHFSRM
jgi:hypothetical protein